MKFFKYLFFLILIAFIGGAFYIASINGNYEVESKRILKAPASVVFDNVNDYKNWKHWGPWYEMDSTIVAKYPEKTSGKGASYSWTSSEGVGSMKTVSVTPNKEILQKIDFGAGSTPDVFWKFNEVNNGTEVTWGMKGTSGFIEKIYWLTQGGIEKNMKPMYERGLELLDKHIAQKLDEHHIESKGVIDYGGGFYLYVTSSSKIDKIGEEMSILFPKLFSYMGENNIVAAGSPFTLYHKWDEENNTTMFSCCVPVKERIITSKNILLGRQKPQKTFKTILTGDYRFSKEAWDIAFKNIAERGLTMLEKEDFFEVYTNGVQQTKNPTKWITEIYIPVE